MNKKRLFIAVVSLIAMAVLVSPAMARQFTVGGRPLNLFGYVTQGVAYGLHDEYDTEEGVNQLLFNFLVEGDYRFTDELKLYAAGMFTADWIYDVKDGGSWEDRLFDKSSDNMHVDDEYWQLLKEVHVTWTPGDFMFRVGKQIVAWGETDGFRLMDQINPLDQRRGMADVEFETSIIPIWLAKAEYYLPKSPSWLQDLGFEFIFNPNADFIPDQVLGGNDKAGIWAPNVPGPFPFANDPFFGLVPYFIYPTLPSPPATPGLPPIPSRVGSATFNLKEPDSWNSEGFEYGFRIKGVVHDAIVTLNYFYGRENSPLVQMAPTPPGTSLASDGTVLVHPTFQGYYPRLQFVGATFARDITPVKASVLGGVAPVVRLEGFYSFGSTFDALDPVTQTENYVKSDEVRWAAGVDWKVKIAFLNPRAYFMISPQFYHRKLLDYPSDRSLFTGWGQPILEDNYMSTLLINTSYLHNKLVPSFFWLHDLDNHADMYRLQLVYDYSNEWHFTLGALFLNGQEPGNGVHIFENKDYLYFKISYKWG